MTQRSARHQRLEAQMLRTVAALVPRAIKDPRVGNLTITAVRLQDDLSAARIWFVPFAADAERARDVSTMQAGLNSAAGFLRGEIARQLHLRHAPRLEFELDTSLERAQALTALIQKAVQSDEQHGSGGGGDEPG